MRSAFLKISRHCSTQTSIYFRQSHATFRIQTHVSTIKRRGERYKLADDETTVKRPNRNQIKFSSAASRRTSSGTQLWRAVHVFRKEHETEHVVPIPEISRNIRLNKFSTEKERYYVKDRLTGTSSQKTNRQQNRSLPGQSASIEEEENGHY